MDRQAQPVVAHHRKRGTKYVEVTPGADPSYAAVTTIAGSKYIVRTASIEPGPPKEQFVLTCSKCKEPPKRAIVVYNQEPPPVGEKDLRDVRIIRFCVNHWGELEPLLPTA